VTSNRRRPRTGARFALLGVLGFVAFLFSLPEPKTSAADAEAEPFPSGSFAVVDALVFDGEAFREGADVLVEAGRVKAIGPDLELPDGLPRVDGHGRTLLPGLIDAHVHSFGSARADALRYGVTTLLDQFTHPQALAEARRERETIGPADGADLFSAGFLATTPGGHGTEYGIEVPTLTGPGEAAAWVDARIAEGSDWIKIVYDDASAFGIDGFTTLRRETMAALVAAAHARGRKAVVHVARRSDALEALEAGADGLVHVWVDETIDEADAARFAEAGVFVTPTFAVNASVAGDTGHRALLEGPADGRLSAAQRASLTREFPPRPSSVASLEVCFEAVRRLHAAGVRLLAGTDAPNPGTAFGISLHRELQQLQRAGLSAAEALAAATSAPADAYGIADRGRLAPGQLGDLLLVEGDVRDGLEATLRAVAVWKDGALADLVPPAEPGAAAPARPERPRSLGSFDAGGSPGWVPTTDSVMGGASSVALAVEQGALAVRGQVKPGFAFPWSGAAVALSEGAAADLSDLAELRFRARGGGPARVLLIVPGNPGPPPSLPFEAGATWGEVSLRLADFPGDRSRVQAIAFVAGPAPGAFELWLDDVELR